MIGLGLFKIGLGFGTAETPPDASGDVTPTSPMALTIDALRTLIASSATFQAAVGATGMPAEKLAAARQRVHVSEYKPGDDNSFERPYALIVRTGAEHSEAEGTGYFNDSGTLDVLFEREIPEAYTDADQTDNAELDFSNFIDTVIAECQALSSQAGYLITRSWRTADGPWRDKEDGGDTEYYGIYKSVEWGLQG